MTARAAIQRVTRYAAETAAKAVQTAAEIHSTYGAG